MFGEKASLKVLHIICPNSVPEEALESRFFCPKNKQNLTLPALVMNEDLVWRHGRGALSFFFYCHIRKVIFSIVEEHSCICSTINSQWNREEAVCFVPAKARIMSSTERKKDRIYKRYKTEWLRKQFP